MDIDFFAVRVSINGTCICLKNRGGITVHIFSIWINNATLHLHYDANFFLNPGETNVYVRTDIPMPKGNFVLKPSLKREILQFIQVNSSLFSF